jgi:excinuclease ABC subunit A
MNQFITIRGARLHNLKNITLSIPKYKLVVFTGLSGSGKSTLAVDTLHKEGQRQYLESLGMVTYALTKPPVDSIEGLSPSISVDQHLTNRSPRSTVGTVTEIYTYLRVLFARLGHRPCPHCGGEIAPSFKVSEPWDDEANATDDDSLPAEPQMGPDFGESGPCPHCGQPVAEIGMAHFSFNKPDGACPTCTGLGVVHQPDLARLMDEERSLLDGAVSGWDAFHISYHTAVLQTAGKHYGFLFDPAIPVKDLSPVERDLLLYGVTSPQFRRHFPDVAPPETVSRGRFEGIVTNLLRRHSERADDSGYREKIETLLITQTCPACQGARLKAASRAVMVAGRTIVDVARLPLTDLAGWLDTLPAVIPPQGQAIVEPILDDLRQRVRRVVEVGLGYLTLERSSPTLSGGEAQRLRLAALLGSGLTGVLYVLDEPTISLHPRDTGRLIDMLRQLRDLGNTVLVIEHDLQMMRAADYLVDIGPGAGRDGGHLVAAGSPAEVAAASGSLTGEYLAGRRTVPIPQLRRSPNGKWLTIHGARAHNLRNITVRLPLGLLVAVTGVSGSGKSSLMFDIFDRAARQRFYGANEPPETHDSITGWENLDKIITMDQSALGRTTRSNAATYTDAFTPIREAFAATPEARQRGLNARDFSFNVPGGRCERCQGAGVLSVEMHFLPDVTVRCPACRGRRFTREVLSIHYHGHNIASVLNLTIAEALGLFADVPAAASRLKLMVDVGLGYLQMGQPASTFSGGEAQRVKLAKELGRRSGGRTLYLLDEPTTGLHPDDTVRLLDVLQRLVDNGNTVIAIEHNLDLIAAADWVIDLGPEGGVAGGDLIAEGTPAQIAQVPASHTGACLQLLL